MSLSRIDFAPAQRRRAKRYQNAPDTLVPVYGTVIRETNKAILIRHRSGPAWLPKRLTTQHAAGVLLVPNWLVWKRGLEGGSRSTPRS